MAQASSKETEYIVGLNNNPRGPFNREDLVLMARGGLLNEKTRIFVKGWEKWKTIGEVDEIRELLEMNPPVTAPASHVPAAPAPGPARLPDGWDADLRSTLATLQGSLDKLGVELVRRTDQLSEGQKLSIDATVGGQGMLNTALAGQLVSHQDKTAAILKESAEKTRQAWTGDLEALELGLADRIKPLETEQKAILRQLEEQKEARKAEIAANRESFERLQRTLSAEKEKELLAFSERVEDMDRRFSALQQAFFLSTEQLKESLAVSLASWDEKSRQQQAELLKSQAGRHDALLSAQTDMAMGLGKVREELEQRLDAMASERRTAGEEAAKSWAAVGSRLDRWDAEWPKQLQAVITEIQNTPGRLDGLFAKLEREQQATAAAVAKLPQTLESRFAGLEAKQREGLEQTANQLDELQGLMTSQSETFGVRMDAQLQTLQAASETRSSSLAADLESRMQSLAGLVAAVRDGIREFEDISLERYSVLLAAADDQRAIPERVNRQLQDFSEGIKVRMDQVQEGVGRVQKEVGRVQENMDKVQEGVDKAASVETRLADLARVQAERLSEELASSHQDHLRRIQASDEERHQHFMALSEAFNGVVAHLDQELPARLAKMEGQIQTGIDKASSELAGMSKIQLELARTTAEEWKAQKAGLQSLGDTLKGEWQSGHAAQQKDLAQLRAASLEGLKSLSDDLRQILEKQAGESLAAVNRAESALGKRLESGQQSVLDLGRQQQALRDSLMQSLSNLGGWTQSLHEKMEMGLAAAQLEVSSLKAELQGQLAGGQEALQARFEVLGKTQQDRHEAALQAVEALGTQFPKALNDGIRGAVSQLEKRLADSGAEIDNRFKSEGQAREKSAAELASVVGRLEKRVAESGSELGRKIEAEGKARSQAAAELTQAVALVHQTQAALQKTLTEELAAGWARQWTVLNADLSQIKSAAAAGQEQLAQRLAGLEGKIPAAMAEQLKAQSQALQGALALLSKGLESQEKRLLDVRQELEKQIANHFSVQQRSADQLLKLVQDDVADALGAKWDSLYKEVAVLKSGAASAQKTLVDEINKAVARLPDHLAESYRVTNNAMQKQLAEMAQDVNATTQQIEQSRATLEKTGATHLASLQEATESARQQAATAIRDAKDEREHLYAQLFQELKNWQLEQRKILAAVLKSEKKPADGKPA